MTKVWFVARFQFDNEDWEGYEYDAGMDSQLFAVKQDAIDHADDIFNKDLRSEADRFEQMVARHEARRDAYMSLGNMGWTQERINLVFRYDEHEEPPQFKVPVRRKVLHIDVVPA